MNKYYLAPSSDTIEADTASVLAGSDPHVLKDDGDGESQVVNPGDEEPADGSGALSKQIFIWDDEE